MRRITRQDHSDDESFYWNKEICISYGCKFSLMCTGLPLLSLFLHMFHAIFRSCEHVIYLGEKKMRFQMNVTLKKFFIYISITDLTVSVSDQIRSNQLTHAVYLPLKMPTPCVWPEKVTLTYLLKKPVVLSLDSLWSVNLLLGNYCKTNYNSFLFLGVPNPFSDEGNISECNCPFSCPSVLKE